MCHGIATQSPPTPGGDRDDVIPSVFLGHTDGEKLRTLYTYQKGRGAFVVRITDNQPFDINAYLLPFAIVVGICFVIMLSIMVFKCVQVDLMLVLTHARYPRTGEGSVDTAYPSRPSERYQLRSS